MSITIPLEAITPVTPFALPCDHSTLAQWHWACPACGYHLVAYWTEGATPASIAQDARCTLCRQAGMTYPPPSTPPPL